eukprot:TRINITY_DN3618_c0_g1_i2.p1 TRINITY_DN3618_c0_g1~~TRINITY_DN3618_c0_g1_i2.p1  ORF type:complete len:219 (+),score=29.29 TRINITY_DN3618_c0_g1_i2:37-657(+)
MVHVYEGVERKRVIDTLESAREEQVRVGLEAAKNGEALPEKKPLMSLCGNIQKSEDDCDKFWEGRKQRLNDTIRALGLVEPASQGAGKPGTPYKQTGTPNKPTYPLKATPAKPTAAPSANPGQKRKLPPTPGPNKKSGPPPCTPDKPERQAKQPKYPSSSIKVSHWNNRAMRFLMAQSASGHDLSANYVMPRGLPANIFARPPLRQ